MSNEQIDQLIEQLEKQEIEAASGTLSAQLYAELFATYLYKNELSNARFLWKRIPSTIKNGNVELEKIWNILNHLWDNDVGAFYKAVVFEWSPNVAKLMAQLKEKVKTETVSLVALAYSSIFEDRLCTMLNETPEALLEICKNLDWEIQNGSYPRLIIPKKTVLQKVDTATAEDQLAKLTDFVSFLEN